MSYPFHSDSHWHDDPWVVLHNRVVEVEPPEVHDGSALEKKMGSSKS